MKKIYLGGAEMMTYEVEKKDRDISRLSLVFMIGLIIGISIFAMYYDHWLMVQLGY